MKYKLELTENQLEELRINVGARVDELIDLVEEAEDSLNQTSEYYSTIKPSIIADFSSTDHLDSVKETLKTRRNEQRAMKQVLNKINKFYK